MKVTADAIRAMKGREPIASLTAYDYPTCRLLDEAGIPLILVGDSLGMVVLGYADTTYVTMQHMEHHVAAAARAQPKAMLVADLPHASYETPQSAISNARRLLAVGAEGVKAEGGRRIAEQVKALVNAGIPFLGHLGMLPQSVRTEGGYRVKGRTAEEKETLMADAEWLAQAGAFAIVLELIIPEVAASITKTVPIPTIGIGSGDQCDGQILVTHDLLGGYPWFVPRHVKPLLQSAELARNAVRAWKEQL